MQWKLIQRILGLGMGLDRLMNFKICATMHSIIIVKLYYPDLRIVECGMLWAVAIRKWKKSMRHKDVLSEPKIPKTDRE